MKKEKFHPYKIHLVQKENENDFDRRIEFIEIIMNRIQQDGNFIIRILFSGESTICLNGHVNRHNYWMEQIHTQRPEKLNVWCGIIGYHVIGSFFINETYNVYT